MASVGRVVIVAPTIVRYTFKMQRLDGWHMDNVEDISIEGTGVIGRDDVRDDFNSHIAGYWQDSMLGFYATSTNFLGVSWIDLDDSSGPTGTLGPAGGHATHGNGAGPFSPPQVAALIHKQSSSARGQRNGRMYISDVPEAFVDDSGKLQTGSVTAYTTAANAFRTAVSGYERVSASGLHPAAWRVVHVHKLDKNDASTWTWSSSDVINAQCDPFVGTQRRRLRQ